MCVYVTSYVTLGKPFNCSEPCARVSESTSVQSDWKLSPLQMQGDIVKGW